jgi:HPt (histidine-containing phosphotransfer) domain-containing protein
MLNDMEDKTANNDRFTETLISAGDKIPGYDVRKGLAAVDDDTEAWREVTQIFIDTTPGILETLKAQCEENDPQYPVTVHGIKGVCYSVGAVAAGDMAKELELRSKDGDIAFVRIHTGNLVSTIEKLIVDLTNLLEKIPADR